MKCMKIKDKCALMCKRVQFRESQGKCFQGTMLMFILDFNLEKYSQLYKKTHKFSKLLAQNPFFSL